MRRFRRYPDYRDSGLEWLGEVPTNWEVVELGSVGAFSKGRGGTKLDEKGQGVPCVRYGDLYTYHDHHIVDTRSYLDEQAAEAYTPITYGDVLFAASGETLKEIGKSAVNLIQTVAVCGGDVIVFRPEGNWDPCFLGYSLGSVHASHQKATMGRGFTVVHIYIPQLRRLRTVLPPISEQRTIADFLDRQTNTINRLVRKKELLIKLLNEKRASLISQSVTRGLDPESPMRDSGVEWLGRIPSHWEVVRLKVLATISTGSRDTVDRKSDGRYLFFVRSQVVERIDTWSFDGEAVLTAGDGVGVARVFHYTNGKFDYHQRVYKFSDFAGILGRLFFYYFSALLRFETQHGTAKSTVDSLRLPMLQNFPVALPQLPEQRAIADFLDRETGQIDALVAKTRKAVERLREYRASVISAAVTGQIDVRTPPQSP